MPWQRAVIKAMPGPANVPKGTEAGNPMIVNVDINHRSCDVHQPADDGLEIT
jgi:hypothetical protein